MTVSINATAIGIALSPTVDVVVVGGPLAGRVALFSGRLGGILMSGGTLMTGGMLMSGDKLGVGSMSVLDDVSGLTQCEVVLSFSKEL